MSTALDIGHRRWSRMMPPPIVVNGEIIERAAIARETQNHPAATAAESTRQATVALVVRTLLLQEARRRDLPAEPRQDDKGRLETADEALIRALVDIDVAIPSSTKDEVARYYDANRRRFRTSSLYEVSHILIAARQDDPVAMDIARKKATEIAADLMMRPNAFATIAKAFSDCPSASDGGYLGQTSASDVTPEFATALETMADGETTHRPVETRYGCHVIRLLRRIPGRTLPLEAVADRIADYLRERSRRVAIAQFIARLVSSADIRGIEMTGAEHHRVF